MKKTVVLFMILSVGMLSCDTVDSKRAIKICQSTKVQMNESDVLESLAFRFAFALGGLSMDATWMDLVNLWAESDPNTKLKWNAMSTENKKVYIVSCADEKGWGLHWEVDVKEKIVKLVNGNEYLSRKYGLSRKDIDNMFAISDFKKNVMRIEKDNDSYASQKSNKVYYTMEASVMNKSGKNISHAELTARLQVIYKDKTINSASSWQDGFTEEISKDHPWKPNTTRKFHVKTSGVETVYLEYDPEYVFFTLDLLATDPIGFEYSKNILEYDMKSTWNRLKTK